MHVTRRRIISSTRGHGGASNDQTIVRYDSYVDALRYDPRYNEYAFRVYDENGEAKTLRGVYEIVDAGYHRWRVLQSPLKHTSHAAPRRWSKQLESVRKDVEVRYHA